MWIIQCGTTLGIQIVYQILVKSGFKVLDSHPELFPSPVYSVPWLAFKSSQDLYVKKNNNDLLSLMNNNSNDSIRVWKTHSNLKSFPCINGYNGQSKVIHITRNPKDVVCSGYAFF